MITNEERRRVAQNLRNSRYLLKPVPSGKQVMSMTRAASELELAHEMNYLTQSGFERLADLIDRPTCNMDVMTTDERADYECSEHIMRCLNCGAEFGYVLYSEDGDVSMDDKPNYCPYCGTRVVSDDD